MSKKTGINDERLRSLLQMPTAPDTLAAKLHSNLQQQIGQGKRRRHWWQRHPGLAWMSGIATALFATLGLVANLFLLTPAVVVSAVEDARHDVVLQGNLDEKYQEWLSQHKIRPLPGNTHVSLSKNCVIAALPSKHIRFTTPETGTVNLFIHAGPSAREIARPASGQYENQGWVLLKPGREMLVIALYEPGTDTARINSLLGDMFLSAGGNAI